MYETLPKNSGPVACAECRRGKLKCNRVFPCHMCIKRGYEHMCPEGVSEPRLSATGRALRRTVSDLNAEAELLQKRVVQLQAAFRETCRRKAALDTNFTTQRRGDIWHLTDAANGLSYGDDMAFGERAGWRYTGLAASDSTAQGMNASCSTASSCASSSAAVTDEALWSLPDGIIELSNSFPIARGKTAPCMMRYLATYLPSREEAEWYTAAYYDTALSVYNPIPEAVLKCDIVARIYGQGLPAPNPCHLSVVFTVCAVTALQQEDDPHREHRSRFYQTLGKAAFCLSQGVSPTTIDAILLQTQLSLSIFDTEAWNERGMLLGVCRQLITASGMHKDLRDFPQHEIEERRRVFWQFCFVEWTYCLQNGTFPSFVDTAIEVPFPPDPQPFILPSGEAEPSLEACIYRHAYTCVGPVARFCTSSRPPDHEELLRLSHSIEAFALPSHLRVLCGAPSGLYSSASPPQVRFSADPRQALKQFIALKGSLYLMLMLHRRAFMQAVDRAQNGQADVDVVNHKYAASATAVFNSAVMLATGMRSLHAAHPEVLRRYWRLCSSLLFTSIVVLTRIAIEQPQSVLARDALKWLDGMVPFYQSRAAECNTGTYDSMASVIIQKGLQRAKHCATQRLHDFEAAQRMSATRGMSTIVL